MLKRANENEESWNDKLEAYSQRYPQLAEEFKLAVAVSCHQIIKKNYQDLI